MVTAVVGAQYGSEGKGVVVSHLAHLYDIHVRVGGPNAGHTLDHEGEIYKMQSVPCGWVNPRARLVIGRGATVDLHQLVAEVEDVEARSGWSIRDRLFIDGAAAVITNEHRNIEGGVNGPGHLAIGSTGEGVGVARLARMDRMVGNVSAAYERVDDNMDWIRAAGFTVCDTVGYVNRRLDAMDCLLEGTQGCHLSLIHGRWPWVTSSDTNAAQLASDVGIAPNRVEALLVARTFPIRVAGNSGPLPNEATWEELGFEPEVTTVTKKIRRVARFDADDVARAIMINGPKYVIWTFMDYINKKDKGKIVWSELSFVAHDWIMDTLTELARRGVWVETLGVGTGMDKNDTFQIAWSPEFNGAFFHSLNVGKKVIQRD